MVLISGSLAYDQIMDFPGKFADHIMPEKLHILNLSFLVEKLRKGYGGTAGNIAYTLALLKTKPAIFAVAGKDFSPYQKFLKQNGVDTRFISISKNNFTSSCFGITDISDNQIWGFYSGADSQADSLSVRKLPKPDFMVIAPNNPKAMLKFAGECRDLKIPYLFDPGMQLRYFSGSDLKNAFEGAKIIIGNDYEIAVMEKKTGIKNLHKSYSGEKIIITTLGKKGSILTHKGETYRAGGVKIKGAVDPAGAGDAYRGGFMAGYIRGLGLLDCMRMGSLAAAYTVEKYGTTTHFYTLEEFKKRYKKVFGEVLAI